MAEVEAWVMIPKMDKDKTGCVIDMRPLVLCKDCKHRTRRICNNIELWECEHIRYKQTKCGVTDDWFCADGEARASCNDDYCELDL